MLTESFVAATLTTHKPSQQITSALKDVGIFLHEFQPQSQIRQGYKKSSVHAQCLAISDTHIFGAQAGKAVINVYSREKGNQEATIPFPERIKSLAYAEGAAILILGTESGKLVLWEVATGRLSTSAASHLQAVSSLCIAGNNDYILSGSPDSSIHVWSLPNLVSLTLKHDSFSNDAPTNAPLRTFSNHRSPITALASGHSKYNTNFGVSASGDGTCYVWHIDSGQVLRAFLLPTPPLCAVVDPVDRAIYFGDEKGQVIFLDLFNISKDSMKTGNSEFGIAPIQITSKDTWKSLSDQVNSIQCLTLSYDGTALLSGHSNGAIIQWDVAKRRVGVELTSLGQAVTNIEMLPPDGLQNKSRPGFVIASVVKPKLEFSSQTENGTCGIPASYNFQASLTGAKGRAQRSGDDGEYKALTTNGFPESMLDAAIRAMDFSTAGSSITGGQAELGRIERLENEVAKLKQQLAVQRGVEEQRRARKMARIERREELGLKKRQAYFEAKKKGKDGDAAMKEWEEKETMVDVESDDEVLGEGMDIN